MNRFDRVTAILIQLQAKKVIRAQDLAARFGVSMRTIYRDIRSLEEAGIPLYGEAGIGYSIADGYRLPPIMFTSEEAIALLTAEKLIEKLADTETARNYSATMFKIRSVLKMKEKDVLEEIEENIVVRKKINPFRDKADLNFLPNILHSIAKKQVLRIEYFSMYQQENSQRLIEPLGILFENDNWHLIAYCRLRSDFRDFRIDRIRSIKLTDYQFRNEHPSLSQYLDSLKGKQNLHQVILEMAKDTDNYIEQDNYHYGLVFEEEVDEKLQMTFLTQSLEGFARWLMMFGNKATILQPDILKQKVMDLAQEVLCLYPAPTQPSEELTAKGDDSR